MNTHRAGKVIGATGAALMGFALWPSEASADHRYYSRYRSGCSTSTYVYTAPRCDDVVIVERDCAPAPVVVYRDYDYYRAPRVGFSFSYNRYPSYRSYDRGYARGFSFGYRSGGYSHRSYAYGHRGGYRGHCR